MALLFKAAHVTVCASHNGPFSNGIAQAPQPVPTFHAEIAERPVSLL